MDENILKLTDELIKHILRFEKCECDEEKNEWCIVDVAKQLNVEIFPYKKSKRI